MAGEYTNQFMHLLGISQLVRSRVVHIFLGRIFPELQAGFFQNYSQDVQLLAIPPYVLFLIIMVYSF